MTASLVFKSCIWSLQGTAGAALGAGVATRVDTGACGCASRAHYRRGSFWYLTCRFDFDFAGLGGSYSWLRQDAEEGAAADSQESVMPPPQQLVKRSLKFVASVHFFCHTKLVQMLRMCKAIRRCRPLPRGKRAQQRRGGSGLLT